MAVLGRGAIFVVVLELAGGVRAIMTSGVRHPDYDPFRRVSHSANP
jgi:hypothetical protein